MGYIDDNLIPGENVICRARYHWIIFLWTGFLIIFGFAVRALINSAPYDIREDLSLIWKAVFILSAISFIVSLINYITSEFGVTNKRVLAKFGFVKRRSLEIMLTKVESIQVDQGIFGRLLGFGTIAIGGTGGSKNPFRTISRPLQFRKYVQEQVERVEKQA